MKLVPQTYKFICILGFVVFGSVYFITMHKAILKEKAFILLTSIQKPNQKKTFPVHIKKLSLYPEVSTSTEFAFVAMLSCNFYLYGLGAAKLGHTLRSYSNIDLIILELYTRPIPGDIRILLYQSGWKICKVPIINGPNNVAVETNRFLLASVYSKFHAWQLIEYTAVVLMDLDTLAVNDPSDLFTTQLPLMIHANKSVGAVRDHPMIRCYGTTAWNIFNAGMLLIKPNINTYNSLVDSIDKLPHNSASDAEQALINVLLKDSIYELPFVYNVLTISKICEPELWMEHEKNFRIVHFTTTKPWGYSMQWTNPEDPFACWFWNVEEYCLLWDIINVHAVI